MTVEVELVDADNLDEKLVMVEERENVDEAELGRPDLDLSRNGGTTYKDARWVGPWGVDDQESTLISSKLS